MAILEAESFTPGINYLGTLGNSVDGDHAPITNLQSLTQSVTQTQSSSGNRNSSKEGSAVSSRPAEVSGRASPASREISKHAPDMVRADENYLEPRSQKRCKGCLAIKVHSKSDHRVKIISRRSAWACRHCKAVFCTSCKEGDYFDHGVSATTQAKLKSGAKPQGCDTWADYLKNVK